MKGEANIDIDSCRSNPSPGLVTFLAEMRIRLLRSIHGKAQLVEYSFGAVLVQFAACLGLKKLYAVFTLIRLKVNQILLCTELAAS